MFGLKFSRKEEKMIRIVYVFHRRKDISRKKCHSYWKDIHAQKVKEHADVLGITGYAQLHTTGSAFFNWMMRKMRKKPKVRKKFLKKKEQKHQRKQLPTTMTGRLN